MPIVDPSSELIQPYDFRRPPWISRQRRAVLDGVHERLTAELERLVTQAVRPEVSVEIGDSLQVAFSDWRSGISTPITAFVAPLGPEQGGEVALLFEPTLACRLVDRMLGGSGDVTNRPAALTAVEQAVLGKLADRLLGATSDAYREVAVFTPGQSRYESIAESLAIVEPHERLLVVEMAIVVGTDRGVVTLVLPASRIARFAAGKSGEIDPLPQPAAEVRASIARVLLGARVPVRARLTSLRLTARESARLSVGQVYAAPHIFAGTVEIDFNGKPAFFGALGKNEERVALRLLERADSAASPPRLLRRMDNL